MKNVRSAGAAVIGAVAVAALVPGMTGASGTAHRARVTGVVNDCGGPAPGHCAPQTGWISAINAKGDIVATRKLIKGRYSLALAPGRYSLRVESQLGGTVAKPSVAAKAHRTTTKNIVIGIP